MTPTAADHAGRARMRRMITQNYFPTIALGMLSSTYLFLEVGLTLYLLGFGWHQWKIADLFSSDFLRPAAILAAFWFLIDQIAVRLGLWAFPAGTTLSPRVFSLPIEEYMLFALHTVICFVLVRQELGGRR